MSDQCDHRHELPPACKPAKVIDALNFGKETPPKFDVPIEVQIDKKRNHIINSPYQQIHDKTNKRNSINNVNISDADSDVDVDSAVKSSDFGSRPQSREEDIDAEQHFLPLNLAYTMLPPVGYYGKFNLVLGR